MKRVLAIVMSLAVMMVFSYTPVSAASSGSITRDVGYDCIYFGHYPQTEIVSEPSDCGAYGKKWCKDDDYIVDRTLYVKLMKGSWDSKGDITIDGVKYHKIRKADAVWPRNNGSSKDGFYDWEDATTEHYYRYEPIKWRVLNTGNNKGLLLSDIALDDRRFNTSTDTRKWENSSIRTWLNGTFYNTAFGTNEKSAIITSTNTNKGNLRTGKNGGNSTKDKVFLLSESETYTDTAVKNGFNSSGGPDNCRDAFSSTYARARGVWSLPYDTSEDGGKTGTCQWWLRSPGSSSSLVTAVRVDWNGEIGTYGDLVNNTYIGVRPAIRIDLSMTDVYEAAPSTGVLSTITFKEISGINEQYPLREGGISPNVQVKGLTKGTDFEVAYEDNDIIGTATAVIRGIGKYQGEIRKTFEIVDSIDISEMTLKLSPSSFLYKGAPCCPEPTIEGLEKDADYTVEYLDNDDVGIAEIVVTGIDGYIGTIRKTFKIFQDISTFPMEIAHKEYTYSGSSVTPGVTVTDNTLNTLKGASNDTEAVLRADLKTAGKVLKKGSDYSLSYSNNKKVGKATVTVKGVGKYGGSKAITFKIKPKKAVIKSTLIGTKKITIKMKTKVSATGGSTYQIKYRIKGKSEWKTTTTTSSSKVLKSLKKGKKYQIKVRAYKTVKGVTYYGAWSKIKTTNKVK